MITLRQIWGDLKITTFGPWKQQILRWFSSAKSIASKPQRYRKEVKSGFVVWLTKNPKQVQFSITNASYVALVAMLTGWLVIVHSIVLTVGCFGSASSVQAICTAIDGRSLLSRAGNAPLVVKLSIGQGFALAFSQSLWMSQYCVLIRKRPERDELTPRHSDKTRQGGWTVVIIAMAVFALGWVPPALVTIDTKRNESYTPVGLMVTLWLKAVFGILYLLTLGSWYCAPLQPLSSKIDAPDPDPDRETRSSRRRGKATMLFPGTESTGPEHPRPLSRKSGHAGSLRGHLTQEMQRGSESADFPEYNEGASTSGAGIFSHSNVPSRAPSSSGQRNLAVPMQSSQPPRGPSPNTLLEASNPVIVLNAPDADDAELAADLYESQRAMNLSPGDPETWSVHSGASRTSSIRGRTRLALGPLRPPAGPEDSDSDGPSRTSLLIRATRDRASSVASKASQRSERLFDTSAASRNSFFERAEAELNEYGGNRDGTAPTVNYAPGRSLRPTFEPTQATSARSFDRELQEGEYPKSVW